MERPIEGPDPYTRHLTSEEAGRWLGGISDEAFEALMAAHLPTVAPIVLTGRKKVWTWHDVACLAHVIARSAPTHAKKAEK